MLHNPDKFSFIIADDDLDDQLIIQAAVRSGDVNMECNSAFNGRQLLSLLLKRGNDKYNQSQTDAIILDLHMNVCDGLETLKQIKSHDVLRHIPVFILNSLSRKDYSIQCKTFGIAGMYVKPGNIEQFRSLLKEISMICSGKLKFSNSTVKHPDFNL